MPLDTEARPIVERSTHCERRTNRTRPASLNANR